MAHAQAPGGGRWELARRGDEWVVRADGRVLMSSRSHGSEEALARAALARATRPRTVLVGGLGLGFTLRAALDGLASDARVVVAELVPELVSWNRGPLAALARDPLSDPRVVVVEGDVLSVAAQRPGAFDAVLLDVDNGPTTRGGAVGRRENGALYGVEGAATCAAALRPRGVLAVWSAGPAPDYVRTLSRVGLAASSEAVPARDGGRARHVILLGIRAGPEDRARRAG